mmetsp:Transcript_9902/g.14595  ORF Transcript_9902/g.14595 Transcript_9902/m.14595 type:complete len:292 (+) Transcript_9902:36-911(+)
MPGINKALIEKNRLDSDQISYIKGSKSYTKTEKERIMEFISTEEEGVVEQKNTLNHKTMLACKICLRSNFQTQHDLDIHNNSEQHKRKKTIIYEAMKSKNKYFCKYCNVNCDNEKNYNIHLQILKHKENEDMWKQNIQELEDIRNSIFEEEESKREQKKREQKKRYEVISDTDSDLEFTPLNTDDEEESDNEEEEQEEINFELYNFTVIAQQVYLKHYGKQLEVTFKRDGEDHIPKFVGSIQLKRKKLKGDVKTNKKAAKKNVILKLLKYLDAKHGPIKNEFPHFFKNKMN